MNSVLAFLVVFGVTSVYAFAWLHDLRNFRSTKQTATMFIMWVVFNSIAAWVFL